MADIDYPIHTQVITTSPEMRRLPTLHEATNLFFLRLCWLIEHGHFRGPHQIRIYGVQTPIFLPRRLVEIYEDLLSPHVPAVNERTALNSLMSFVRIMRRGESHQGLFGFAMSLCVFQRELRELVFLASELHRSLEANHTLGLRSSIGLSLEFWHRRLPITARNDMYLTFGDEHLIRGIQDTRSHDILADVDDEPQEHVFGAFTT